MTTNTLPISPNGAVGTSAEKMAELVRARALGRARFDLLRAAPGKARAWVAARFARTPLPALAGRTRGLLARALGYLAGKFAWVLGCVRTAGTVNVVLLVLTTSHGRDSLDRVLRTTAAAAARIARVVLAPFAFLAGHTGRPGRALRAYAVVGYCAGRDRLVAAYRALVGFFASRDARPAVGMLRTLAFWSATVRLGRRFIPNGWMRLLTYLAISALLAEDEHDTRFIDRAVAAVKWPGKAAVDPASETEAQIEPSVGTRTVGVVVDVQSRSGDSTPQWRIRGGHFAPDPHATEIVCRSAEGTPVPVMVHTMADGSTVYECGHYLYTGVLPDGASHVEVAAKIAATGTPSRAAQRFMKRMAARTQTA